MTARLLPLVRAWLIAIDQLLYVSLAGPFYLAGLAELPRPQETLSSIVGRKAVAGHRWALMTEQVLDGLFLIAGEPPGHSRRSIITF